VLLPWNCGTGHHRHAAPLKVTGVVREQTPNAV